MPTSSHILPTRSRKYASGARFFLSLHQMNYRGGLLKQQFQLYHGMCLRDTPNGLMDRLEMLYRDPSRDAGDSSNYRFGQTDMTVDSVSPLVTFAIRAGHDLVNTANQLYEDSQQHDKIVDALAGRNSESKGASHQEDSETQSTRQLSRCSKHTKPSNQVSTIIQDLAQVSLITVRTEVPTEAEIVSYWSRKDKDLLNSILHVSSGGSTVWILLGSCSSWVALRSS